MKRFDKTISIDNTGENSDKKILQLQAIKEDIGFKEYLDSIISDRAKALKVELAITEKPLKKGVKEVDTGVIEGTTLDYDDEGNEKGFTVTKLITSGNDYPPKENTAENFDLTGKWSKVDAGIHTNGKCFRVRSYTSSDGMVEEYFNTEKEARAFKK